MDARVPHVKLRCPLALTGFNAHATKENTHLVTTNLAKKLKTQSSAKHPQKWKHNVGTTGHMTIRIPTFRRLRQEIKIPTWAP